MSHTIEWELKTFFCPGAGAKAGAAGFWFDDGLFKLPTVMMFWIWWNWKGNWKRMARETRQRTRKWISTFFTDFF